MASEIERQQREDRQWNSYKNISVIRGHHIYKSVWTQIIGERSVLVPEDNNKHDKWQLQREAKHSHKTPDH